eukprot:5922339-Pyramimonas_sp.AAC.1
MVTNGRDGKAASYSKMPSTVLVMTASEKPSFLSSLALGVMSIWPLSEPFTSKSPTVSSPEISQSFPRKP